VGFKNLDPDSGDLRVLLAVALVMATMVVTLNRFVWRPLYALASPRFKLES
jgi:NitT/TauT family transport system permease protein